MASVNPLNVLIVEDEILLATELGYLVEEAGCCDIGHAESSDEAIALTGRLRPDLVLVDVHLRDGPTGSTWPAGSPPKAKRWLFS